MLRSQPKTITTGRLAILGWIGCVVSMGCAGHRECAENPFAVDPFGDQYKTGFRPFECSAPGPCGSCPHTHTHASNEHHHPEVACQPPVYLTSTPVEPEAGTQDQTVNEVRRLEQGREQSHEEIHEQSLEPIESGSPMPTDSRTINDPHFKIGSCKTTPSSAQIPVCIDAKAKQSLVGFRNPTNSEVFFSEVVDLPEPVQALEVALPSVEAPVQGLVIDEGMVGVDFADGLPSNILDLNLPSALAMIDGTHPAVGMAKWRVREAYARLAQAEVLWLPSIQAGFSLHRHDGNYQASNGDVVDVNRNSFQYGLGMGATGAGTTQRPGLVAEFHLADAIFQPDIAEKTAWARGHAAKAVVNEQLMNVAIAYNDLLDAHQDSRILEESRNRMADLFKITSDFAEAGEGLRADADRVETELILMDSRIVQINERIAMASARLAEVLSIDASSQIMPTDLTVVPLDLVPIDSDKSGLIQMGLSARPELKESQALVAAACEAYKREKYAPMVPSMLLGFSTGGFGGGLGGDLENSDSRYDFDALMSWEIRNLGFGEKAARRTTSARVEQAKFEKLRVMDEVARQISESYSQIQFRRQQLSLTQQAISTAQQSYDRNVSRIRDGQGLPVEVLQSVQALEIARRAYLTSVVDYNEAQFRLQWALGWPVSQG